MGFYIATHGRRVLLLFLVLAFRCFQSEAYTEGDPWHELGLRRGHATPRQVRAAYLRLAKELHPDKNREGVSRGADKTERFKRVQRAYEKIVSGDAEPAAQDAYQTTSVSSTARRAGSMPAQQDNSEEATAGRVTCINSESYDMRVFTDSVGLEDMEEDLDEGGFVLKCRCGGSFLLPSSLAAEHAGEHAAVNCQLCSLWIWVRIKKA